MLREEKPYHVAVRRHEPSSTRDTDGDGVRDGADDQDHDDIPNVMELSRDAPRASTTRRRQSGPARRARTPRAAGRTPDHEDAYGRVNPFNPCLPDVAPAPARTHGKSAARRAPFDGSPNWYSLN